MPTETEIKNELEKAGHKARGATCACAQQAANPNYRRETGGEPSVHFCARYFTADGALRKLPNIEASYANQPHADHLFGLPAYGAASAAPTAPRGELAPIG